MSTLRWRYCERPERVEHRPLSAQIRLRSPPATNSATSPTPRSRTGKHTAITRRAHVDLFEGVAHMTFALAWLTETDFGVVADSAVTVYDGISQESGPTSLGQSGRFQGYTVQESALKIYQIAPSVIFTAAGNQASIDEAADSLRMKLLSHIPELAVMSYQEDVRLSETVTSSNDFEGLLCYYSDSRAKIIMFMRSGHFGLSFGPAYVGIGSMKNSHIDPLKRFCDSTYGTQGCIEDTIAFIVGLIASQACHEPLLQDGIGGPLFAGSCRSGKWSWMQDTALLLVTSSYFRELTMGHEPPAEQLDVILSLVVDGIGVAQSSIIDRLEKSSGSPTSIDLYINKLSPDIDMWIAQHSSKVVNAIKAPSRLMFVSVDSPRCVGLLTEVNSPGSPEKFTQTADGILMNFSERVGKWLALKLARPDTLFYHPTRLS